MEYDEDQVSLPAPESLSLWLDFHPFGFLHWYRRKCQEEWSQCFWAFRGRSTQVGQLFETRFCSWWARLAQAAKSLRENGGIITSDLDDPKLTHIIVDDDDSGRYAELSRRTSQYIHHCYHVPKLISRPKRKHIVLPSWVEECLEEETLMSEDGTSPPVTQLNVRPQTEIELLVIALCFLWPPLVPSTVVLWIIVAYCIALHTFLNTACIWRREIDVSASVIVRFEKWRNDVIWSTIIRSIWIDKRVGQRVVSRITIYTCYIQHSYFQQLPLTSHIHKQQCQKDLFYSFSLPPTRPSMVK